MAKRMSAIRYAGKIKTNLTKKEKKTKTLYLLRFCQKF